MSILILISIIVFFSAVLFVTTYFLLQLVDNYFRRCAFCKQIIWSNKQTYFHNQEPHHYNCVQLDVACKKIAEIYQFEVYEKKKSKKKET